MFVRYKNLLNIQTSNDNMQINVTLLWIDINSWAGST